MVGVDGDPNSLISLQSQINSFVVWVAAMYSALAVDRVTNSWLHEAQETAALCNSHYNRMPDLGNW